MLRLLSTSSVVLYSGFRDGQIGLGHDAHLDQAGARHSQSPMKAEGGAVIAGACAFYVREATEFATSRVTILFYGRLSPGACHRPR
jgi:hypothetical protein